MRLFRRIAIRTERLAAPGRRPFDARHPVYRAAHRCISPVYRFGADVTVLAKPLKSAQVGASRRRTARSRLSRARLSVDTPANTYRSLSLFFFLSLFYLDFKCKAIIIY